MAFAKAIRHAEVGELAKYFCLLLTGPHQHHSATTRTLVFRVCRLRDKRNGDDEIGRFPHVLNAMMRLS